MWVCGVEEACPRRVGGGRPHPSRDSRNLFSADAQVTLIHDVHLSARLDLKDTGYVEAHVSGI